MSTSKRFASFCKITGHVTRHSKGVVTETWECDTHGTVQVIPYYSRHKNDSAPPIRLWACPQCILIHHDVDSLEDAKEVFDGFIEKDSKSCEYTGCPVRDNLIKCEECGEMCCPTHRVMKECSGCYDRISDELGVGWGV